MLDGGAALRDFAGGLRARANALRSAAHAPSQALVASGWTGGRAQELEGRLGDSRAALEAIADECDRMASHAEAMAGDFAADVRRMREYEAGVRAWMRSAPPEQLQQFDWAGHLPSTGSPQWTQVTAAARRSGASL
jgi:hypothetical protein